VSALTITVYFLHIYRRRGAEKVTRFFKKNLKILKSPAKSGENGILSGFAGENLVVNRSSVGWLLARIKRCNTCFFIMERAEFG